MSQEELLLDINPDEIKRVSEILADALIRNAQQFTCVVVASGYQIVEEDKITEVVNLDYLASSTLGIMDILGQISGWFRSVLDSVAAWIVSSVQSFVEGVKSTVSATIYNVASAVSGFIDRAVSTLRGVIDTAASTITASVRGFIDSATSTISGVVNTVSATLRTAIDGVSAGIRAAIDVIVSSVSGAINTAASALSGAISTLGATLQSAIAGVSTAISNAIGTIVSSISGAINSAVSALSGAISTIGTTLSNVFSGIAASIMNAISGVVASLSTIASNIMGAITSTISAISGAISTVASSIMGAISAISGAISTVASSLMGAISGIASTLSGMISGFVSAVMGAIGGVMSAISGFVSSVMGAISAAVAGLTSAISGIASMITGAISAISGAITTIASSIMGAISGIASTLSGLISSVMGAISTAVTAISGTITAIGSSISAAISSAVVSISGAVSKAVESISASLVSLSESISKAVGKFASTVMDAVAGLGKGLSDLWGFLVNAFTDMAAKVGAGFDLLGRTIMGFVNAILQLPVLLEPHFRNLGVWVWDALPEWFRAGLASLSLFFKAVAGFIRDPITVARAIVDAIWGGLKWLGEKVWDAITFLGEKMSEGLQWLWGVASGALTQTAQIVIKGVASVCGAIFESVTNTLQLLAKNVIMVGHHFISESTRFAKTAAKEIGKILTDVIEGALEPMGKTIGKALEKPLEELVKRLSSGKAPKGEWLELMELLGLTAGAIVGSQYIAYGIWGALHSLATPLERARITIPIIGRAKGKGKASPAGVGAEGGAEVEAGVAPAITINLGLVLRHIAREIRRNADTFGRSIMYGAGIWFTQPMMRLASSVFRNQFVLELPSIQDMAEITRRHMPLDEFKDVLESYRSFLRLYGYNDKVIEWLTSTKIRLEVIDRFGQHRIVPLSLMYNLPSASDVARMAIRDIFGMGRDAIESFLTIYQARGMHPDIGILYYLLHYRYPPPERLWTFVSRGVSGMLWATIPEDMIPKIQQEAEKLGAPMPTSAAYWNFRAKELYTALQTYMTWHDMARFSWFNKDMFGWDANFTSDNQIVIDTLADIPTKIDMRWLVRWGIYEHLSTKGVTYKSPVKDFALKVLESAPASQIQLDLTNFARTLQATGLHPDWVPVTALAETMNVLADERTLLRTGFINLFKEGFYDINALETLLAGFIKASFQVAYFDSEKMEWTTGWINLPVMFLPPERKLLQLRALMDRALDILREIQKDISVGYQEFIIASYTEYRSKLTQVIDSINEFYAKDYEAITGVKLPDELKLKFVEEYYKPYVEALRIWRDVFTVRRIRMWTQRWLGWVMYRVAYGVVEKEDVAKLVTLVKDRAKLTDAEESFIRDVMDTLYGIAKRNVAAEYLPTPSTLATLSEYMTLDKELVKKVLVERGLDETWQNIWLTYIAVKPIKSDAKSLLSAYRRAFRYGVVTEKELDEFIKTLPQYGFTDKEVEFITKAIELDEKVAEARENRREYIPTPSTLATIAEYVILDEKLIKQVFEARNVPAEWIPIWSKYINARPIADDVRGLLAAYRRALTYVKIPESIKKNVEQYASLIGFTDREWAILALRVQLEDLVADAREARSIYIPTPQTLASLAEYVVISPSLVEQVFTARNVPAEWQPIWRRVIDVRPIVDDVRGLLTSYRRALTYVKIPETLDKRVKEYAALIGFTDREWDVLALRVALDELVADIRAAKSEYIPSPLTLASMAEYIPEARKFFAEVVRAKRIPPEWQPLWAKYVDIRPLVDDVKRYVRAAEELYVRFMTKVEDFDKILEEASQYLGYTPKEIEFLKRVADFERYRNAWTELIGSVERLVSLSEYSPKASKYALGKLYAMIDALPLSDAEKKELKEMWEEYIRCRPVKAEARTYITQLINLYVDGLIAEDAFSKELDEMKKWGFSDDEIKFYKAQADLRRKRKLRIPVGE